MSDKIKIFTISDHPLSPSGVGTQTKYMIEGMLKTGKYQFVSFGGAIKHPNHEPQRTEEWGDDWIIWPVNGYGNPDMVRAMIHQQKPDILWFMTDPRFFGWLWEIEDEIREYESNKDFGGKFTELARSVYFTNDKRSEIKKRINRLSNSEITEEKSYAEY